MSLIERALERPELRARPPVLLDVGASGELPARWRRLAPYAICIAFDADQRDFGAGAAREHPYRTLHLHPSVVTDRAEPEVDFHLTRSPYCSSTLEPAREALAHWTFADLFDVERTVRLSARTLPQVLAEHGLSYVDWFKTDSQGTDLRLFLSLGDAVVQRVLLASFEPGIIDAYVGEDKLHALLARMDALPFWMHEMEVQRAQRLARGLWQTRVSPRSHGFPPLGLKPAPAWAEVSYLNTLEPKDRFDTRDLLLAWVFASLHEQHGFALEIAIRGRERFADPFFDQLAGESLRRMGTRADRLLPAPAKRAWRFVRSVGARFRRS
jgi:hypothetical protein